MFVLLLSITYFQVFNFFSSLLYISKWEEVCRLKEFRGLGVKDVVKFNRVLLAKWRWRVLVGEEGYV